MNYKKEMIKMIEGFSGGHSSYEVFSDFVKCAALSVSNFCDITHGELWKIREKQYIEIIGKYEKKEQEKFPALLGLLTEALTEEIEDVLGDVYMMGGMGNKSTGQFFTPFHVSLACARLMNLEDASPENPLKLNEPSTGGGGMIIATVRAMKEKGINPQHCLEVVAQDLDWKGVYMTYLQLSLLGIKAIVVQGDTLVEPFTNLRDYPKERVFLTPARKGMSIW